MFWQTFGLFLLMMLIAFGMLFMVTYYADGYELEKGDEFAVSLAIMIFGAGICCLGYSFTQITFWESPVLLTLFKVLSYVFYCIGGIILALATFVAIMITCPALAMIIITPYVLGVVIYHALKSIFCSQEKKAPV